MNGKIISGPAAILILLLFFLPWLSVSCGGIPVGEFTGYQLASSSDGDPLLFIIPLTGIISLILLASTLWKPTLETNANWGLILAPSLSLVVLLLKWFQLRGQNDGTIEVDILTALWFTIIALIAMVLGAVYDLFRPPKNQPIRPNPQYGIPDARLRPPRQQLNNPPRQERPKAPLVDKNTMVDDKPIADKSRATLVDDEPEPVIRSRETIVDDDFPVQPDPAPNRGIVDNETERYPSAEKPPILPVKRVNKTEVLQIEPELTAWLVISKGDPMGERFRLYADNTIGRDPDNDIYINDTALSALHLRVKLVNGRFMAYDQDSTNGLFSFNHERERWEKKDQIILQEGTRIKLGRTVLVFMSVDKAN